MKFIENTSLNGERFNQYTVLSTEDDINEYYSLIKRIYDNGVNIEYTINNKVIHIYWIESEIPNNGNGTNAVLDFISEYNNFKITLESVPFLVDWYKKMGFIVIKYLKEVVLMERKVD